MRAIRLLLVILCMTMAMTTASAQKEKTYNLWSAGAPNSNGNPTDTAQITVFLPPSERATGRAVVACPGGGYSHLAMAHEGTDWAPFFNQQGIALIVLKYRMPRGNYEVPVSDAEEAIRFVRRNAKQWHIDADQIVLWVRLLVDTWHQLLRPTRKERQSPISRYCSILSSQWTPVSHIAAHMTVFSERAVRNAN